MTKIDCCTNKMKQVWLVYLNFNPKKFIFLYFSTLSISIAQSFGHFSQHNIVEIEFSALFFLWVTLKSETESTSCMSLHVCTFHSVSFQLHISTPVHSDQVFYAVLQHTLVKFAMLAPKMHQSKRPQVNPWAEKEKQCFCLLRPLFQTEW